MRMARIAAFILCFLMAGCELIPERGVTHVVHQKASPVYPNCLADESPRFSYRKRIAFVGLDVKNRNQLRGLYGIENRYMEALSARIERARYHPIKLSHESLNTGQSVDLHGQLMTTEKKIRNLARRHRAQFVVGGEILDMGQQQVRNRFSSSYRSNPLLGAYTSDPERMIAIRLDIYDGFTGLLLDQESFNAWSKDAADLNTRHTLMGERFMHTALGLALEGLLEQQKDYVSELLSCIALQGEIRNMATMENAVLSLGASQGLRPGDQFKVYRKNQPSGIHEQSISQRSVGTLLIKDVYPEHALGQLESDSGASLRQGDWVRAW